MKRSRIILLAALLLLFAAGCEGSPEASATNAVAPVAESHTVPLAQNKPQDYRLITSGCVMEKMALCVVLVDFEDIACTTADAQWSAKAFGENGSLRSYYAAESQNHLNISPVSDSSGENDGVVRVRLPMNHPDQESLEDEDFTHDLVNQVMHRADPYVDFSASDQNGDGILWPTEFTPLIVLAGYEKDFQRKSYDPTVGAHMHFTDEADYAIKLDDSSIEAYLMIGELVYDRAGRENRLNTVEIIAHETGHALGLPDLYDTDDSSLGVGIHSVMGSCIYQRRDGSMNEQPVEMDSYSKLYLGFATPQVAMRSGEYVLYDDSTGKGNILLIPTQDPNEFFLLENRQFTGYDAVMEDYMDHSGIVIWHINSRILENAAYKVDGFSNLSAVNDDEAHKGVDIEEANEAALGYAQLDKNADEYYTDYDHYFAADGFCEFGADTQPSSALSSGEPTGISVRVIKDGMASAVQIDFMPQ